MTGLRLAKRVGLNRTDRQLPLPPTITGGLLVLLQPELLAEADDLYFSLVTKTYVDDGWNESGLRNWEQKVVDEHFDDVRSVLITAVGGGREALALEEKGYEVSAVECNPDLVAAANELLARRGFKSRVVLAARDRCPNLGRSFDAAIVGWGAYSHIRGRATRIDFLRQMVDQVRPGGILMLSCVTQTDPKRFERITASGARVASWLNRSEPEYGDDLDPEYQHYFSEAQLTEELGEVGVDVLDIGPGHSKADFVVVGRLRG